MMNTASPPSELCQKPGHSSDHHTYAVPGLQNAALPVMCISQGAYTDIKQTIAIALASPSGPTQNA